jgi:Fur family peroxide stress response transcriptional regulator
VSRQEDDRNTSAKPDPATLTDNNLNANHLHVKPSSISIPGRNSRRQGADARRRYFISQCRFRGIRVTAQRLAVFQTLAHHDSHPTADSLYTSLLRAMPSLSISTVYRILELLEKEGLIRRVGSTNGIARYDGNLHPHQHLVCRRCGRMTDYEDPSLSHVPLPRVHFAGFAAEELDIRIVGL